MFILASSSPRRRFLLESAGLQFCTQIPNVDETPLPCETIEEMTARLALLKASAVATQQNIWVLAADTAVGLGAQIFGKPRDAQEAESMLRQLSGQEHKVVTSFALQKNTYSQVETVTTQIRFRSLSDMFLKAYVASHESFDKAGGYGIQDNTGAVLIDQIHGSYTNAMGLPLTQVLQSLEGKLKF